MNVPVWLGEIVKARIERLRLLGLEGQPLGRAMGAVTRIWAEVLARELAAAEPAADAARVHAAFDRLEASCQRWPAPAELIGALPARAPAPALAAPPMDAQAREELRIALARLRERLALAVASGARGADRDDG